MLYLVSGLFCVLFSKQFFLHFLDTFEVYTYLCRIVHGMGLSECPHDKYRSCNFDRNIAEVTLSFLHSILIRLSTISVCSIIDEDVHFDHLIMWCLPGFFSTVKIFFYYLMVLALNCSERVQVDFHILIPECSSYKYLYLKKTRGKEGLLHLTLCPVAMVVMIFIY